MQKMVSKISGLEYFTSGEKAKLLIHGGTHGDEAEVIGPVMESLGRHESELPPFLFVPRVSPSAVEKGTRVNQSGRDMNREFFSESEDVEVQANIEIIKDKKFDLFVSFHEDPGSSEYYLYDVGYSKTENLLVLDHNRRLEEHGIGLLNGVDDAEDPCLGYEFEDGYKKMIHPENYHDDGTISAWVLNRHIAEEYLLPEIPGISSIEEKRFIVESFFREVILKFFR